MSRRGAIERASGEYAPRATAQGALFPPFAGVALADILANSAAIVIIMIVVTLVARREEEEQKLEQAEDVAVLLSRELATSFVMNALPTSAPARLHDYVTWPPDRNPQHAEMPIIELHAGFLRDYYTGAVYGRDDLLRHGNAFDDYLASLGTEQLLAMRIDVYSIHEFYIAMSILKAHGVQPRHWHFLVPGANKAALEGPVGVLAERLRRDRPKMQPSDGWAGDGTGTVPSARPGSGALPNDVALAGAIRRTDPYPEDALGFERGGGGRAGESGETLDLPSSRGGEASGQPASADPGASATGSTVGSSVGSSAPGSAVRFRTARPVVGEAGAAMDLDLHTVLRGLFAFMRSVQADADAHRPSVLPGFDFVRDVLGRAEGPSAAEDEQLIGNLADQLAAPVDDPNETLAVVHRAAPELRGQALAVPVNRPLYVALWLRGPKQPDAAGEQEATVTAQLGLHAAVYQGLRVPFGRDSYLLMPRPEKVPDREPRWRVVTLVNASVNDFVTGFVYASVDDDGRLRLGVDENAVEIHGLGIESQYPAVSLRGERRQLLFYGLIGALFAIGLVVRVWKRA